MVAEQETPTTRRTLDPADFAAAKEQARKIPRIMMDATPHVKEGAATIGNEYRELQGNTISTGAGLFGALERMNEKMLGPTEAQWFRKAAILCRHVMNSMLGRALDDAREYDPAELSGKPQGFAGIISQLHHTIVAIDNAFPPQQVAADPPLR